MLQAGQQTTDWVTTLKDYWPVDSRCEWDSASLGDSSIQTRSEGDCESGSIEIGFSLFGPTIGITGTLQAEHKPVSVKSGTLTVKRTADSATHSFQWKAFRSTTISFVDPPREIELPDSFLLRPESPFRYNMLFNDGSFVETHTAAASGMPAQWHGFRDERIRQLREEHSDAVTGLLQQPVFEEGLFNQFQQQRTVSDLFSRLDHAFYWEAGQYSLEFDLQCSEPARSVGSKWTFQITDEESRDLRLNTIGILRALCGLSVNWIFTTATYRPLLKGGPIGPERKRLQS